MALFKVLRSIRSVAYKLDLPPTTRLHPVFHVSCLKKKLGHEVLIHWKGASSENDSWELLWTLQSQFSHLVGKVH
jgi:hypothetical protein